MFRGEVGLNRPQITPGSISCGAAAHRSSSRFLFSSAVRYIPRLKQQCSRGTDNCASPFMTRLQVFFALSDVVRQVCATEL